MNDINLFRSWFDGLTTNGPVKEFMTHYTRERDLPSRLDRLELKVDRIPWFILASWLTVMLTLIGGLYLK